MPRKSKKSTDESQTDQDLPETEESAEQESPEGEELPQAEEGAEPISHSSDTDLPDGPTAEEISDHVSKSGNKVFEEGAARESVGAIRGKGTGAYIEIVTPRQPALEAAMRAEATAKGLADGSIKPEDSPGAQLAEGDQNPNDGGSPEFGNSRLESHDPNSDPIGDKRAADSAKAEPSSQLTSTAGSNRDGTLTSESPVKIGTEPLAASVSADEGNAEKEAKDSASGKGDGKPSVEDLF